jgi:tRNA (adenine22-N1)-methyltransferase
MRIALSKRLRAIADMVPEHLALADIGTDHGLLLCYLAETGRIPYGIGVELNPGPLERARATVRRLGLESRVEIRRGNGLSPLKPGEADAAVIAGMGGFAVRDILDTAEGRRRQYACQPVQCLVLQPMMSAETVRRWLAGHHWKITVEDAVKEGKKYYQIIKAEPGKMAELSMAEACYGPILVKNRHPLLKEIALKDFRILQGILDQMAKASLISEGLNEDLSEDLSKDLSKDLSEDLNEDLNEDLRRSRQREAYRQKAMWMEDFMEWL